MAAVGKRTMSAAALLAVAVWCAACVGYSAAAVYKVGDSTGWTILNSPNYTTWALSKSFRVGDVILFEYNKQFHNVMQVSHADYSACNASSPLAAYATGNDSIKITSHGHHFFICGVPTHCGLGQRVDINVPKSPSSAAPSTAPSAAAGAPAAMPTAAPGGASASSPKSNHASPSCATAGTMLALSIIGTAALSFLIMA